ncbi:MAG: helicase C-terminal domain-containing protein, partial [Halobacteria archaeon]|nr:helicase C-terminal domain-containing protein [Halobacteria archaeon]
SMSEGGKKALFTYLWGTLTEGVDFPDDTARTVVVLGVGYPYLSERKRAVQDAYDEEFGDGDGTDGNDDTDAGWKYAVEAPTIRKTR